MPTTIELILQVDADGASSADLRKRFSVTVYPSLQLFPAGRKCPASHNKRGIVLPWYHPYDLLVAEIRKHID
jgi:hypothetical protein